MYFIIFYVETRLHVRLIKPVIKEKVESKSKSNYRLKNQLPPTKHVGFQSIPTKDAVCDLDNVINVPESPNPSKRFKLSVEPKGIL